MATATTLMTAEEFALLPDDPVRPVELVKGSLMEMSPAMPRHGQICFRTGYLLQRYLDDHSLGIVLTNDSNIVTERDPDTVRGADVAYYSYQRVPKGPLPAGYLAVAPDLVFEVLSPNDRWTEVLAKVAEYLAAGVQAVCVLNDATSSLQVFHADGRIEQLSAQDELSLPTILQDFSAPVSKFFE
jgi:Uma2 family endonuclease